jgi:hypothetical protein
VIYEEDSDSCYWCNPVSQILNKPSKLEKKKPSIEVSKNDKLSSASKRTIMEEVKRFYHQILRLKESQIECDVIPVLMPNYRVVPFHNFFDVFKNVSGGMIAGISGQDIELLPSWMSILRRIDPSRSLSSIRFRSKNTDLVFFISEAKRLCRSIKYGLKEDEWITFILSPVRVISMTSAWSNELTNWTTYSKVGERIVNDFDYSFNVPKGFLRQVTRRARSWDFFHFVNPQKDIAIQFFGAHGITPTIKNIDRIHEHNVKGQYVLWESKKSEIETLVNVVVENELTVQIIHEENEKVILAITTLFLSLF